MKRFLALSLFLFCPVFLACASVKSTDVKTSGVLPTIQVTASGDGKTAVYTSLRVGGPFSNTFLDLSEGDRLVVTSDEEQIVMTRNENWTHVVHYTAELHGDAADKSIEISFLRPDGENAPSSIVTLSAPFEITRPVSEDALIGSQEELFIEWANPGKSDEIILRLNGNCIDPYIKVVPDTGSHRIAAGTFTYSGEQESADCKINLMLARKRVGKVDPAFAPRGIASAFVERKISFAYSP